MDLEEIKSLVELVEKSRVTKFHLQKGAFSLEIVTNSSSVKTSSPTGEAEKEPDKKKPCADGHNLKSPMVGTFYSAPSPDQPPFVKIGDEVKEDTVVGIIEAMKVMNEVKAGVKGLIKEMFVENGQPVEFGMKLFRIT